MNFLIAFVNTFLVDYFFIFIINLLPIKNKLRWQIGVISITNLPSIIYDVYNTIVIAPALGVNVLIYIGTILSKTLAYIAVMVWLLQGRKIFKTRRQREFMREYNGKSNTSFVTSIILIILSLSALIFTIYIIFNYNNDLLLTLIGSIIAFILLGFGGIYLLPQEKFKNIKAKVKKPNNLLFILKIKESKVVFNSSFTNELNYYLGTLADDFVLSNHGIIEQDKTIYKVVGIKVDYIDKAVVKDIKMDICKNEKLIDVTSNFNSYQQKYIKIDNNYNIISIKSE